MTTAELNPDVGGLTIHVADARVDVARTGGGAWTWPIGPTTLLDNELERADPPRPTHLTNALGLVHDYFDDIVVDAPSVLATPSVSFAGRHAVAVGQAEIGAFDVPAGYRLLRTDADEVFRTLVSEPVEQRRHNPGLEEVDVETIVATLCIVLSIMRRLDLTDVGIVPAGDTRDRHF